LEVLEDHDWLLEVVRVCQLRDALASACSASAPVWLATTFGSRLATADVAPQHRSRL
jgi:hypothetical protein